MHLIRTILHRLHHLFIRRPAPPSLPSPEYDPDRDLAVRWMRRKRHESEQAERRVRRMYPIESDMFSDPRKGRS